MYIETQGGELLNLNGLLDAEARRRECVEPEPDDLEAELEKRELAYAHLKEELRRVKQAWSSEVRKLCKEIDRLKKTKEEV